MINKPYRPYFKQVLRQFYPDHVDSLIDKIESEYQKLVPAIHFAATSSNPMDNRLDVSAYFLALIKTLERENKSFETIRECCLEVASAYVKPQNWFQALLKRLPIKLSHNIVFRLLLANLKSKIKQAGHPDGFVAEMITDPSQTYGLGYGVDILECGICKLFEKNHYRKYASILCEIDYMTSGLAGLTLIRSGTIANGANKCDFRYKKQ